MDLVKLCLYHVLRAVDAARGRRPAASTFGLAHECLTGGAVRRQPLRAVRGDVHMRDATDVGDDSE